jgi:uncharacterized Tic20 family protein
MIDLLCKAVMLLATSVPYVVKGCKIDRLLFREIYSVACYNRAVVSNVWGQGMQPTEDERVLAALSHASIVANVVNPVGMIATMLIWITQREHSRFVRAHALQSLLYHGMVLLTSVFLALAWGVCLVLSLLPVFVNPGLYHFNDPPRSFWFALFGLIVPIGFGILATIYGLYGAYQVYHGRPFRYPIVGRLVRRELSQLYTPPAAAPTPPPPAATPPSGIYEAPPAAPADGGEAPSATDAPAQPPAARRSRRRPPEGRE